MSRLPTSVQPDSVNSRQHRSALANAINGILTKLAKFVMGDVTDYAVGVWIPTDVSSAGLTFTTVTAGYTRIGNMVFAYAKILYPPTADTHFAVIGGLPFKVKNDDHARQGNVSYTDCTNLGFIVPAGNDFIAHLFTPTGTQTTNVQMSGRDMHIICTYPIA